MTEDEILQDMRLIFEADKIAGSRLAGGQATGLTLS
ncbi:hypothetical protein RHAL1_03541 [Beijerinckiaceae bacterium RH AL1]|nr:hypothetical protein RHAL1_03541 [Beijerinckiaceae bacterium RH AL1]